MAEATTLQRMVLLTPLTVAVGAMNGYRPDTISKQKWFFITTPMVMIWAFNRLEETIKHPVYRLGSGIVGGGLLSGYLYCVGSSFGRMAAEFTDSLPGGPFAKAQPPRGPLLLLPPRPETLWPSTALPAVPSWPRMDSSYTQNSWDVVRGPGTQTPWPVGQGQAAESQMR